MFADNTQTETSGYDIMSLPKNLIKSKLNKGQCLSYIGNLGLTKFVLTTTKCNVNFLYSV